MIWLFKRLFGLGVTVAVVFFILQMPVGGRRVRDYLVDFYRAPLVQEGIRQGSEALRAYLQKDVGSPEHRPEYREEEGGPAMEEVEERERQDLERVLDKESR